MFTALRRLFTAITTATVVKLSADVIELEKQVEREFDWGMKMTRRCADVGFELKKTQESLTLAREAIIQRDEKVTIAESSYRSLLRDYTDQRDELDRLTRENQKLKQLAEYRMHEIQRLNLEGESLRVQLKESIDLTDRYSILADTYYESYERTQNELLLSQTRTQLYRDCYFHNRG